MAMLQCLLVKSTQQASAIVSTTNIATGRESSGPEGLRPARQIPLPGSQPPPRNRIGHAWEPLRPLSMIKPRTYDFSDVDWHRLMLASVEGKDRFRSRIAHGTRCIERHWCIETGVMERLYTLNPIAAAVLTEDGFKSGLIDKSHTNIDPDHLLAVLRDHETSVALLRGYVADERLPDAHAVRELHACITAHQDSHEAIDSLGRRVDRKLDKGAYKRWPNNPTRPDGKVHEYAPPEQVASELDRMFQLYRECENKAHPLLCAAWLHHAFVQIHPFADGNGRTGRALMNWHLMRRGWLPLAMADCDRSRYFEAMRRGDEHDLGALVDYLCELACAGMHQVVVRVLGCWPSSLPEAARA